MVYWYLVVPSWFKGFDSVFDAISLIVCFLIFLYGLRGYKITKQRKYLVFSLAFLFIAISFLFKIADILGFYPSIKEPLKQISVILETHREVINLHTLFVQIQRFFILLAFTTLFFLTRKNLKQKGRRFFDIETIILFLLLIFVVSFYTVSYFLFNLIAAVMVFMLVLYYYNNFKLIKTKSAFFSNLAFVFIFLSHLTYMFFIFNVYFYISAEIFQLVGFLSLLYALILVRKK